MQDLCAVKAQQLIDRAAGVCQGEKIDDKIADGEIEHQIWDALVLIPVTKPRKAAAQIFQMTSLPFLSRSYDNENCANCP